MDDPSRYIMWKYLPYEDIMNLCITNRAMSEICNDPETWRFLLYRDFNIVADGSLDELRDAYLVEREKIRLRDELVPFLSGMRLSKIETYITSMYPRAMSDYYAAKEQAKEQARDRLYKEQGIDTMSPQEAAVMKMNVARTGSYRDAMYNAAIDFFIAVVARENIKDERIANAPLQERLILITLKNLTPEERQLLSFIASGDIQTTDDFYAFAMSVSPGHSISLHRFTPLIDVSADNMISIKPELLSLLDEE